mmetsp:Transcript_37142/g.78795  ORF Transcript_37142/g.78795 Transcript_37142/m.78795 type:complete len:231 (-) Transcript_37142:587-1279(-)|eukprot:CAMPEP_0206461984 /NCGR_PEP_ID=MMETSP0324_2-20121206/25698_1 /ASSEMBLY_ACC=CAM_ASM_000836 /TAXON_ID=2866 /ORGANISM="Crypthecodinium cohnii, Strain Seligo" /LENGTH=230 /DNA_ID=CAMNT_0053934033 /DNA_START=91 /DNA_END=783 /DNA_ORIENTATION=-
MFCCCAADAADQGNKQVMAMPAVSDRVLFEDPHTAPAKVVPSAESSKETPSEEAAAPDAPPQFIATLVKQNGSESIGWQVDVVDEKRLFLCRILTSPSALSKYNASVPEDRQLRIGDYILKVNGNNSSVNSMMTTARSAQTLDLLVQRPRLFTKTIKKDGPSLGLMLTHAKGCPSLCIEGINDGPVKRMAPDLQLGDRIVAVNGVRGDSETLMRALQQDSELNLEFSRAG